MDASWLLAAVCSATCTLHVANATSFVPQAVIPALSTHDNKKRETHFNTQAQGLHRWTAAGVPSEDNVAQALPNAAAPRNLINNPVQRWDGQDGATLQHAREGAEVRHSQPAQQPNSLDDAASTHGGLGDLLAVNAHQQQQSSGLVNPQRHVGWEKWREEWLQRYQRDHPHGQSEVLPQAMPASSIAPARPPWARKPQGWEEKQGMTMGRQAVTGSSTHPEMDSKPASGAGAQTAPSTGFFNSFMSSGKSTSLLQIGEVGLPEDLTDDANEGGLASLSAKWAELSEGRPLARSGLMRSEVRPARVSDERTDDKDADSSSWWKRKETFWGQQLKDLKAGDGIIGHVQLVETKNNESNVSSNADP